jgi:hypothetical protein
MTDDADRAEAAVGRTKKNFYFFFRAQARGLAARTWMMRWPSGPSKLDLFQDGPHRVKTDERYLNEWAWLYPTVVGAIF